MDTSLYPSPPRAVVLLSGGLDSATVMADAIKSGYAVTALSFQYGQKHAHEVDHARQIANAMDVDDHCIIDIDLAQFGGSALTADMAVPKNQHVDQIGSDIPITYVPARNTIFLSLALGLAEVRGAYDIFIGVNALDYSGYPDCRPAFINAFANLANLATRVGVEEEKTNIHAPLLNLTKSEIIEKGLSLGVNYALTTSCYDPRDTHEACGQCDACLLRLRGFRENGVTDPIKYVAN